MSLAVSSVVSIIFIKLMHVISSNISKPINQIKAFFSFIFLFKIKTLGKHYTSTHAHVHAEKEFAWFQNN